MLHPVKRSPQNQRRDANRGERDADAPADSREELHPGRHTRELGAQGAEVRDHQRDQCDARSRPPVVLAHQGEQSLPGDDPHPDAELVEDDQRRR